MQAKRYNLLVFLNIDDTINSSRVTGLQITLETLISYILDRYSCPSSFDENVIR